MTDKPRNREQDPDYQYIGKPMPRHDAWDKVFGRTKYADDFDMPGMLFGKVLRSAYPAAKILSIDTADAEKTPGVEAVLTAKDVPNNETVTRFGQTHQVGGFEGLVPGPCGQKSQIHGGCGRAGSSRNRGNC